MFSYSCIKLFLLFLGSSSATLILDASTAAVARSPSAPAPSQTPTTSTAPSETPTTTQTPTISLAPSETPTTSQTPTTSLVPSKSPTRAPSQTPTTSMVPSKTPTRAPSQAPSTSMVPSETPSRTPSQAPTISQSPSSTPSESPSTSSAPSDLPSAMPSIFGCPKPPSDEDDECNAKEQKKAIDDIENSIERLEKSKEDKECDSNRYRGCFEDPEQPVVPLPQDDSSDSWDWGFDSGDWGFNSGDFGRSRSPSAAPSQSPTILDTCDNPYNETKYDEAEQCKNADETICSLLYKKDSTIRDFEKSCNVTIESDRTIARFESYHSQALERMTLWKLEQGLERRDGDLGLPPDCAVIEYSTIEPLFETIKGLEITQIALEITAFTLEIAGDYADAVPFGAGGAVEAGLKGAGNALRIAITKIESAIANANKVIRGYELFNMDCTSQKAVYSQKMATLSFNFLENADPQIDRIQREVETNQEKIDVIDTVVDENRAYQIKLDPKIDRIEDKIDIIDTEVDENQLYLFETLDPKIDQIDKVVDENQLYLEFVACRYKDQVNFLRNGCDGLDNDCDSVIIGESPIVLVDECDEDQIPPTVTLVRDIPPTFLSLGDATNWFEENTIASDDCVPSDRLKVEITGQQETDAIAKITVHVYDTRCYNTASRRMMIGGNRVLVDGPGESSTTEIFTVYIDGTPPHVTCGFNRPQDANFRGNDENPLFIDRYNVRRDIANVQFFYEIEELPLIPEADKDVQVTVTISSNEFERSDRIMTEVLEQKNQAGPPRPVVRVNAFFAPFTCGDYQAGDFCVAEFGSDARFYDINVVATDPSGNVGEATCTVVAVPEYQCYPGAGKGCGKSSKKERTYRPTRNELIGQLESSEQRYTLDTISFVWNTGEDDSNVPPAVPLPTRSPKSAKSSRTAAPTVARSAAPTISRSAAPTGAQPTSQIAAQSAAEITTPSVVPSVVPSATSTTSEKIDI